MNELDHRLGVNKILDMNGWSILSHGGWTRGGFLQLSQDRMIVEQNRSVSFVEVDECIVPLSDCIAIRISSDTRPHNLFLSSLQKGLRLVYKGKEKTGEGIGFGVPVPLYSDDTYFSGSSRLCISSKKNSLVIRKEFIINRVQRKVLHEIKMRNPILREVWRYLDRLYQEHQHLQTIASVDILGKLGIHLRFEETEPVGKVIAVYSVEHDRIGVKIDSHPIRRANLRKLFVLNEQGSEFFMRYSDSDGTHLVDREIGAWGIVKAQSARITDQQGRLGFQLWRTRGSTLFIGREFIKDLADWIGLDYGVNPENDVFEYKI